MLDLPVHRVALLAGQDNGVGPLVDMLGRAGLAGLACLRGVSDLTELDGDGAERQPEAALVDLAVAQGVDHRPGTVTVAGRRVALKYKEFQLLVLLASNPGRVYSRESLLSQVWEYDYLAPSTFTCAVRSKIESPGRTFIGPSTRWATASKPRTWFRSLKGLSELGQTLLEPRSGASPR